MKKYLTHPNTWRAVRAMASTAAAAAARRSLGRVWRSFFGGPPPRYPLRRRVEWHDAIVWAAASAAAAATARLAARELAGRAQLRITGVEPSPE